MFDQFQHYSDDKHNHKNETYRQILVTLRCKINNSKSPIAAEGTLLILFNLLITVILITNSVK